jgi:predicted alpha/beta hydrolase family esterase
MANALMKFILIPGNNNVDPRKDAWFPFLASALIERGHEVVVERFPDSFLARERYWIPFIKDLGTDENTILIGHSSGAIAAMRYAERNRIYGSVLVSGYYSHLWNPIEMLSGYFFRPWDFGAIKENQQFIIQFASADDGLIPVHEARVLHKKLDTDYTEFPDRQHFHQEVFPEILEKLEEYIGAASSS